MAALRHAQERQLGKLDMVSQQPLPIFPPRSDTTPTHTHTPKQLAHYVQYTRSINSKPCPPFYFLKEACLNDTPLPGLGSPLCL
jgi:hypothetical protein